MFASLSRPRRAVVAVAAAVATGAAVAVTPLPPSAGLLLGGIAGGLVAALGGGDGEPGPDTPDTDPGDTDGGDD